MMTSPTTDLAARYDAAVEFEREAWQALQAHEPGSTARAEAWSAWSQAISNTNRAWRELNSHNHSAQPVPAPCPPGQYLC